MKKPLSIDIPKLVTLPARSITCSFYEANWMPDLRTGEDYAALRDSIKINGQLWPINMDGNNVIYDGRSRFNICVEAGLSVRIFRVTKESGVLHARMGMIGRVSSFLDEMIKNYKLLKCGSPQISEDTLTAKSFIQRFFSDVSFQRNVQSTLIFFNHLARLSSYNYDQISSIMHKMAMEGERLMIGNLQSEIVDESTLVHKVLLTGMESCGNSNDVLLKALYDCHSEIASRKYQIVT